MVPVEIAANITCRSIIDSLCGERVTMIKVAMAIGGTLEDEVNSRLFKDAMPKYHALRHTFCTRLAMAGVSAPAIQQLPGHKDLSITQVYVNMSAQSMVSTIGMLDALNSAESAALWLGRGANDPSIPS